ncbi:TPA: IGL@ protein-like [Bos taurus]|nr:TPA: IGL@ protein-like [Bos taurus]
MAWSPLLLTLVTLCTGSWAQAGLTQPASVFRTLGQRVTISCTGSSNNIGGYYVSWYQQLPGKAPRLLTYEISKRPPGVPDRFSGSKSGNSASLTSSVHAEDDTDYYCFSWADGLKVCTVLQAREKETKTCFPHSNGAPGQGGAVHLLRTGKASPHPHGPLSWSCSRAQRPELDVAAGASSQGTDSEPRPPGLLLGVKLHPGPSTQKWRVKG